MHRVVLHERRSKDVCNLGWISQLGWQEVILVEIGPADSSSASTVRTDRENAPSLVPTSGTNELWRWEGDEGPTLGLDTLTHMEVVVRVFRSRFSMWATIPKWTAQPPELLGEARFLPVSGLHSLGTLSLPLASDSRISGMVTLTVSLAFEGIAAPRNELADPMLETIVQQQLRPDRIPPRNAEELRGLALNGHMGVVTCCAVFPSGDYVLTGSQDSTGSIWSNRGRCLAVLRGHTSSVLSCGVFHTEMQVITTSLTGGIIWSVEGVCLVMVPDAQSCDMFPLVDASGGRFLSLVGANDAAIFRDNGKLCASLRGHTDRITACAVPPCGRWVFTVSKDATGIIWSSSGEKLRTLCGHSGGITSCAIFPDGQRVVTGSDDRTASIWLSTGDSWEFGKRLIVLEGHKRSVVRCAVVLSGRGVLTSSLDGRCMIWSDAGDCLLEFKGHTDIVDVCVVLPSGDKVLTCSRDGRNIVWQFAGKRPGSQLFHLQGHTGATRACAVFPSGSQVLTVAEDCVGMIWDLTGREWPPPESPAAQPRVELQGRVETPISLLVRSDPALDEFQ